MSDPLQDFIDKAEEYLSYARILSGAGKPEGTITPCYYAYFWLVKGLLSQKGVEIKSHSAARDLFALHYIKTGEIPKLFGSELQDLFQTRQLADYTLRPSIDKEEAKECIEAVEKFLTFISEHYA